MTQHKPMYPVTDDNSPRAVLLRPSTINLLLTTLRGNAENMEMLGAVHSARLLNELAQDVAQGAGLLPSVAEELTLEEQAYEAGIRG